MGNSEHQHKGHHHSELEQSAMQELAESKSTFKWFAGIVIVLLIIEMVLVIWSS